MKFIIPVFALGLVLGGCTDENAAATKTSPPDTSVTKQKTGYNAELAKALGADPYGMHSYVFVTIKTGPNDALITDETERNELFAGHFANMKKWAEDGKLVLAGPFMEAPPKRGLFIFDVDTVEEAKELVKDDPTVTAGIFELEFSKYYGSAALKKVNEIHATLQEKEM